MVGDVHVYVLKKWLPIAEEKTNIPNRLGLKTHEHLLVTLHRAENVDDRGRLSGLLHLIIKIAENHKTVFPMHPRTRKAMVETGLDAIIFQKQIILS